MTSFKKLSLLGLICGLFLNAQLVAQSSTDSLSTTTKKVIEISSVEDLAQLEDIFVKQMVADRLAKAEKEKRSSSCQNNPDKLFEAIRPIYEAEQAELDALDREQDQLVDWYFSLPEPKNNKEAIDTNNDKVTVNIRTKK